MLGKYKEALEDSQTSVKLDSSYTRGYQRAAKALLTLGRTEQVRAQSLRAQPSEKLTEKQSTFPLALGCCQGKRVFSNLKTRIFLHLLCRKVKKTILI